ncbi:Uncharacterized protein dnm_088090 [Desulfonema magnum]|uniref:Uncharacterized protein n=1 Tax=Desulfonema magnum TaxID=45655 RepID=A0A975BVR9_9BACT|nr:Uncharacterized protein dnm_088090 [Desulfonema magnum]
MHENLFSIVSNQLSAISYQRTQGLMITVRRELITVFQIKYRGNSSGIAPVVSEQLIKNL